MPRFRTVLVAALALPVLMAAQRVSLAEDPAWESLGEGVTLQKRTSIEAILARPQDFAGRPVAVEGKVVAVCQMMGCWMELESDAGRKLRIKVEDGVIVFPRNAVGRRVVAQGTVRRLTLTREEYLERARHQAEESGRKFDPETVKPPYQDILLWGTGALVPKTVK